MGEVRVTNLVKFYTVLLLHERPHHGYEIIKELSGKSGKRVSAGEIYPFLKELEAKGYIASGKRGKRDKKIYHLTRDGNAFTRTLINKFGGFIEMAVRYALTRCAHCGCDIYRGGHREKLRGKTMAFCCPSCATSFKTKGRKP